MYLAYLKFVMRLGWIYQMLQVLGSTCSNGPLQDLFASRRHQVGRQLSLMWA